MGAFQDACEIERRGMADVLPFLRRLAATGGLVETNKGRLAREFQVRHGDLSLNQGDGFTSVEVKTERRYTGNLFYEQFSNRQRGVPGWGITLEEPELLAVYCLETRRVLLIPFQPLKRWAVEGENMHRYPLVPQTEREQDNDTWGRLIPLRDVREVAPYQSWTLFPEEGLALPHGAEALDLSDDRLVKLVRHLLALPPLRRSRDDQGPWRPLLGRSPSRLTMQTVRAVLEEYEVPVAEVRASDDGSAMVAVMADGREVFLSAEGEPKNTA